MGLFDRLKKRKQVTINPNAPKQRVFIIGDLEVSVHQRHGAGVIADLTVKGGIEQQREVLSTAILGKLFPDYQFDQSTSDTDHEICLTFSDPNMSSLDTGTRHDAGKPVISFDAVLNAAESVIQRFQRRQIGG